MNALLLLGGTLAKRVGSPGGEEDRAKRRLRALAEEALGIVGKQGRSHPQASHEAALGVVAVVRGEGQRVDARKLRYAILRWQGRNGAQGENVVDFVDPVSQRPGQGTSDEAGACGATEGQGRAGKERGSKVDIIFCKCPSCGYLWRALIHRTQPQLWVACLGCHKRVPQAWVRADEETYYAVKPAVGAR